MKNLNLFRFVLLTCLIVCVCAPIQAQWEIDFADRDFFELRDQLETHYDSLAASGDSSAFYEGGPYARYKRWSSYWSLRLKQGSTFRDYFKADQLSRDAMQNRAAGNTDPWHEIGPHDKPSLGATSIGQGSEPGVGPIHFISFSDQGSNNMLCGSNIGGVWYTNDAGLNWVNGGSDGGAWQRTGCKDAVFKVGDASTWYAANSGYFFHSGAILRGTNYGANWEVIADQSTFSAGGIWSKVYKIATDHADPDVLYVATEHRLYKSNNVNALTPIWTEVNIAVPPSISNHPVYGTYSYSNVRHVYDLEIDPDNSDNLYATVRYSGEASPTQKVFFWRLMKSHDGGATWTEMPNQPLHAFDITTELQEIGGMNVLVATGRNANLMTIEMSKAAPNWLYVFYDLNGTTAYVDELHKVSDCLTGVWIPSLKTDINLLYGAGNGFGVDQNNGQDLYIDHNKTGNEVGRYLSYVNSIWTDYYVNLANHDQYHVDAEDFVGDPDNEGVVWMANHGGIHKSIDGGVNWEWRGNGLGVADVYRMATSYSEPDRVLTGLYHDASVLSEGVYGPNWNPEWRQLGGGDGQQPFIDPDEGNWIYWSSQGSSWRSSSNYGQGNPGFFSPNWPCRAWETAGAMDYGNPNGIYVAGWPQNGNGNCNSINYPMDIKRSLNRGNGLEVISDFQTLLGQGYNGVWRIYSSPYDASDLVVHFWEGQRVFRTKMARGPAASVVSSWKEIYVPRLDRFISDIDFDPENSDVLYFAYPSQTIDQQIAEGSGMLFKVEYNNPVDPMIALESDLSVSVNGSAALPNTGIGSEAVVLERGSNGGIYVGTDLGVFYTNNELVNTNVGWLLIGGNLPNVTNKGLEINYKVNKVRAGMQGRGIWEHDLWCPALPDKIEVGTYAAPKFLEVLNDITSTAIVPSALKVTYRAGNAVHLQPGFHATSGSEFHAYIHPCDRIGNSFKSLPEDTSYQDEIWTPNDSEKHASIVVKPNPTSGTFSILINDNHSNVVQVELINMQGRKIPLHLDTNLEPLEINPPSDLSAGVYLLQVMFADGSAGTTKVIFQP